jgi:tetrahydromethanopterin S-methyltransferase subunit B
MIVNIDDRLLSLRNLEARVVDLVEAGEAATRAGGRGGGGMDDLINRVSRLETAVDAVRKDITESRIEFGRFDERSKHFPTKGFIFSVCLGLLAAVGGLVALIVRFLPPA